MRSLVHAAKYITDRLVCVPRRDKKATPKRKQNEGDYAAKRPIKRVVVGASASMHRHRSGRWVSSGRFRSRLFGIVSDVCFGFVSGDVFIFSFSETILKHSWGRVGKTGAVRSLLP